MDMLPKAFAVIAYVVAMLGIGVWSMRRTRNIGDFFIGGRTIGPWIAAMAYGTTYFSAVLFVGFAGKVGFGFGMYSLLVAAGNALIGVLFAWALLAGRTREMTARLNAITMPEFLEARYGMRWLKPVAALVIFVFLVPYSASVYQGLSHLFEANLGLGYVASVAFMAVLTGVYLVMGGYFAVALTDLFQGLLQVFGVVVMVVLLAKATGLGVVGALSAGTGPLHTPALHPPPVSFAGPGPRPDRTLVPNPRPYPKFPGWLMLSALVFMTSVGPMGLPQMLQKFYSIRGRDMVFRGMVIATLFAALIAGGAYFCGALSHHFFDTGVGPPLALDEDGSGPRLPPLPKGPDGRVDFDRLVPEMLTAHTPAWFSTVVLLIVLAASMSTLSSLVLVSSAAVAVDLLGAGDRHEKDTQRGLLLLRVLCGVFVGLSVVMAAHKVAAIVTLMSMSWGALAGAFIGPYVWGTLWRRTTAGGATAGFLGGLGTAIALFFLLGRDNAPVAASVAMLVSLIAVPIVSMFTPKLPEAKVALAFGDDVGASDK